MDTLDSPAAVDQVAAPVAVAAPAPLRRQRTLRAVIGVVCLVGLIVRAWPRGALWLDEAQSVAIARLPLAKMVGGLREDGAPPLYYLILHWWMALFGSGDTAVRTLTVLISVAFVVLVVALTRRLAGDRAALCALVLVASSSFAVRYASEARMYSLVMLEATLLLLAVAGMLAHATKRRGAAIAVLTASLPYTHYWGIYLVAAGAAVLAVATMRASDRERRGNLGRTFAAVAVGGALWLPWLPVFRYQAVHTATPWTERGQLTSILDTTFRWNRTELAGGVLLAIVAAAIIAALVFGGRQWRARLLPRWAVAAVAVAALVLAALGGSISGSAYVGRYTSVAFPFAIVLAAVGFATIRPRPLLAVALTATWLLGVAYSIDEIRTPRTRAEQIASALLPRVQPGDVIVYCPDQLGPATSRLLDRSPASRGTTQLVYPGGAPPERVDWVDYTARYRDAAAAPFAADVVARAGSGSVWLVASSTYPATQAACAELTNALYRLRPAANRLVADDVVIADHGALWRFAPRSS